MNIRTEQLEALLQQQQLQAKKPSSAKNSTGAEGFEAAFAEQVALGNANDSTSTSTLAPGMQTSLVNQLLLSDVEKTAASEAVATKDEVMQKASGALDTWESYVSTLRMPRDDGNLREAYTLLEDVSTQVSTLKTQSEPVLEQNPNLASLVNELEVLATTEKFKFNRGDYLDEN